MVDVRASAGLSPEVLGFLAEPRYAVVATLDPDGRPHQAVVWFLVEDGGIVLNSKVGRRWPTNALRDRRVSLVVEDGRDYVTVRGELVEIPDRQLAQDHIARMAERYDGAEEAARQVRVFRTQERISFRLVPRRAELRQD